MSDRLLIIVPTYNEADNIEQLIETVCSIKYAHVLVIDDCSPDGTSSIVKRLRKRYPEQLYLEVQLQKMGIGKAYLRGFEYALDRSYEYVLQMDADFSHNPQDIPRLLAACADEGYDLAIGSRYVEGVNVVNWPMSRVLLSYFASRYVRLITGLPVHDATAGFVCYRRAVLEQINLSRIQFTGYAFQIAIKHRAWKHRARIKEVSVIFTDRVRGVSKMSLSIFREAFWAVWSLALEGLTEKYMPLSAPKSGRVLGHDSS